MSFMWAGMLWLLVLVPALVGFYLWLLARKRKQAVRYGSLSLVKEALGDGPRFRRHVPPLLLLAAVTAMLVAMARPMATVTLPSQRGTVILTMDISGSMRAGDIPPSRMAAAQTAARAFIDKQPEHVHIGVVAFAGTATMVQAPTLDRHELAAAIDRFRLQRGTAVGAGILMSLAAIFEDLDIPVGLEPQRRTVPFGRTEDVAPLDIDPVPRGSYTSAVVVLLTDGQTTWGPDPVQAAQLAADLGVRIYTVGLGTQEGIIVGFRGRQRRVRLDEETLVAIAEKTGGEYFRAGSDTDLRQVYESLSTKLVMATEETEITAFFTAAAAAMALIGGLLSLAWFGRVA